MRNLFITFSDGTRRVQWPVMMGFVIATYLGTIAAAETFWKLFTGGYSPLMGLFALFTATLIVIRVIGTSLADPFVPINTNARTI